MLFLSRTLPVIIAFLFGMIGIAIYYIPHGVAQSMERELALWLRIVAAFAYFLGLFSRMNLHRDRIKRRTPGWGWVSARYSSVREPGPLAGCSRPHSRSSWQATLTGPRLGSSPSMIASASAGSADESSQP